jgi:hypothetical protein
MLKVLKNLNISDIRITDGNVVDNKKGIYNTTPYLII